MRMPLYHFLSHRLLRLEGRLYSGNLSEVQFRIEAALDRTQQLIVDLDALENFDEAGAYMLYIASKKAMENNKQVILFCKENEGVKQIFSFVGIKYSIQFPKLNFN